MKELHKYKDLPFTYKVRNLYLMRKEAAYLFLTGRGIPVEIEKYYKLSAPDNWVITDEEEYITNFICTPYQKYIDPKFIARMLA